MRAIRNLHKGERGASLVEFAIVLPLFLLLIGGMVDFGRAFYTEVMLTNGAREGARSAMYSTSDTAAIDSRAWAAAGNNSYVVNVTNPCASNSLPSARVTVTVTKNDFEWILLGPAMNIVTFGSGNALPTTLTGKATMQCGG
ncbi:MAG TPA: TadE/TadG family type IV pilus assembly protein [Flexivirga sp.]|uniref:TadE/TadG family type IV pilus assembly protein n=1 Tax=Flexivirga sp. TaxID=1962927 RepID=UPI002CC10AB3|nr:TadE/TadG family type IV pilus assembly protein [Flexivirga sp.]HWC22242.1 TadE/TadG family type IV pilus assembly protein [Flexivirga sp.]